MIYLQHQLLISAFHSSSSVSDHQFKEQVTLHFFLSLEQPTFTSEVALKESEVNSPTRDQCTQIVEVEIVSLRDYVAYFLLYLHCIM